MVQLLDQIVNFFTDDLLVFTLLLTVYTIILYKIFSDRRHEYEYDELLDEIITSYEEKKSINLEEAVDKKKTSFLNIPTITLHYANEDEIVDIYNDFFKEPTIEQFVSEKAREVGGGVKGEASKLFGGSIEGKDISKWIKTIKIPDISVAEKFRRYQRATIENNQVSIGLDLVDVDLTELNNFNELIDELHLEFDMKLDDLQVESNRASLKEKAVDKTLIRLENATGWILLDGKFKIDEISDSFYKCTYLHPVNEYITIGENKVTISMLLDKNFLKPNISGNYVQSIGKLIPLKVYGKVWQPLDRREDIWDLQITPLAVY